MWFLGGGGGSLALGGGSARSAPSSPPARPWISTSLMAAGASLERTAPLPHGFLSHLMPPTLGQAAGKTKISVSRKMDVIKTSIFTGWDRAHSDTICAKPGVYLRSPIIFFFQLPTATNRQLPTTNRRQPPPTAIRANHQPLFNTVSFVLCRAHVVTLKQSAPPWTFVSVGVTRAFFLCS